MKRIKDIAGNEKMTYALLLAFFCVIIYLYYYWLRTQTIYGDDLFVYNYYGEPDISKHFDNGSTLLKFRPVNVAAIKAILALFNKDIYQYYIFNVLMQAINVVLFVRICNLYLRSIYLSCLASLVLAVSRFNYFNISQLYNGGALETLAMTFFLCSLFCMLKSQIVAADRPKQAFTLLLSGLAFANLSLYTHERYIVILPFIMLCVLLPALRVVGVNRRLLVAAIAILSMGANYAIKKYIFHLDFFTGTGNTHIAFSFHDSIFYLKDALLSILLINSGPEHLVGTPFLSLWGIIKVFAIIPLTCIVAIFTAYFITSLRHRNRGSDVARSQNVLLLQLSALFLLCLIPAIVTIRLEQRWLQASLSVFMLMTVIAINAIPFKNNWKKALCLSIFVFLFLAVDANYLATGVRDIYLYGAQNKARLFKQAIINGVIKPNTSKIYVFEKHKNENDENELGWILAKGYFFCYYGQNMKNIAFVDSSDQQNKNNRTISNISDKEQVIYVEEKVIDITKKYLDNTFRIPE